MKKEVFVNQLFRWYEHQQRSLPWRETKDPYKIWLSEIILQQTRVKQGLPYYLNFVNNYPTVKDLAEATEDEVLRMWQGLGYYSRARNLHKCAQQIVNEYNGDFPSTRSDLLTLKGIGRYTSAAIASFAFNEQVAVVDGNVFRVLARIFGISDDIANTKSLKIFEEKANSLIPKNEPGDFNQAMMDFGATQCTPKKPLCMTCPFQTDCFAFQKGMIEQLPVKEKKIKVRKRYFYYLIWEHENKIYLKHRGPKDIWQGLFDFHLIEKQEQSEVELILEEIDLKAEITNTSTVIKHILTHQQIFAQFIRLRPYELDKFATLIKEESLVGYTLEKVHDIPKPVLVNNYLKENLF